MPERLQRLRAAIHELEQELQSLEALDDSSRQTLEEAVADIQTALREEDPSELDHASVRSRLDESLQDFEVSHPTLAGLLSKVVDMLGQMGI